MELTIKLTSIKVVGKCKTLKIKQWLINRIINRKELKSSHQWVNIQRKLTRKFKCIISSK